MAVKPWLFVAALPILIGGRQASAQQTTVQALRPATGAIHAAFRVVSSVRELADGRLLIEDFPAGFSAVGDFRAGTLTPIKDVHPGSAIRLGGDTTALVSGDRGPWVFLVGTAPVGMLRADNPVVIISGTPRGADSRGELLVIESLLGRTDSAAAVLVARATAAEDTVALLGLAARQADGAPMPFGMQDEPALTFDGWVAVVRSGLNRVDWRAPDGHWTRGTPVRVAAVPLDQRERKAFLARPGTPNSVANWPATIPLWSRARPVVTWDGRVAILRTQSADHPEHRYDIVNRSGVVERTITMPGNQQIVGFGKNAVYVVVTEANKDESVVRHPWP